LCGLPGEPLDRLPRVNGLGGIDADQADLDRSAVEPDDHGFAVNNALDQSDGAVRFNNDSVNQNTWWALGTRANSEVIGADSYRPDRRRGGSGDRPDAQRDRFALVQRTPGAADL
jgi:hypothetical protein